MAVGDHQAAGAEHGLAPRARIHRLTLGRLRRGDDHLHPRLRLADTSDRSGGVEYMDVDLSLGGFLRLRARELRAAVRASVFAHLGGFPRHPGRLHARQGNRLLRELPARDAVTTRVRYGESGWVEGLQRGHLGTDGGRWSARYNTQHQWEKPSVLYLPRAGGGGGRDHRRRYDWADSGGWLDSIRARRDHPRARCNAREIRQQPVHV